MTVWTKEELDFLCELAAKRLSLRAISTLLRKPQSVVRSRIKYSKIPYANPRFWTPEETGIIDRWAEVLPAELLAKKLNRSVHSVKCQLKNMGYPLKTYWDYWTISTCSQMTGINYNTIAGWIFDGLLLRTKVPGRKLFVIRKIDFLNFYWEHCDRLPALQKVSPEIISWLQEDEAS